MEGGGGSGSTPDLQTILATLAQLANPTKNEAPEVTVDTGPPSVVRQASTLLENWTPDEQVASIAEGRPHPQDRSDAASPRPIDPATITTWQDGLRCVTKIAAQNAHFAASIRKMIHEQRAHEMRWYKERQALKQTQSSRASAAAKAQTILRSLSNSIVEPTTPDTEADKEAELARFDRKLYASQLQLEEAMTRELKRLGVPFFGTEPGLVVDSGRSGERLPQGNPKWSPVVTEPELLDLRRRMVTHLEDLYRD